MTEEKNKEDGRDQQGEKNTEESTTTRRKSHAWKTSKMVANPEA